MKKEIDSLQDALSYLLQGLSYAETKVRNEFEICSQQITSIALRAEMQHYLGSTDNKLQKLDRIFNYLMEEPGAHKNEVIEKMIKETHHLLSLASSEHLKDILMVSCFQNINAYKTSCYKNAYLFAVELELDTAADLAKEILEWEVATGKRLSALSIHEFNKLNGLSKTE